MGAKKKSISFKKERVILSDVLPYELPVTFSNRYFQEFLLSHKISLNNNQFKWIKDDDTLKAIIKLLFGINSKSIEKELDDMIQINRDYFKTIPFNYKISHKENDYRDLTIIHPKNQLTIIDFYDKYKDLILYYCSISPFSIRKPKNVAKFTYHIDKTHLENLAHDHEHVTVEEYDKEYENLKTFFTYEKFSNVYKFYESYTFHRCEKKYNKLFKFDISKCFDSIYSHSLSWALLNKGIVKDNIGYSNKTFGGLFDKLMQNLNYGETNGIVIGPEFSRIFAELILQQIDFGVLEHLKKPEVDLIHKRHYEIFRYVDDFFVFYNEDSTKEKVLNAYRLQLKEYKLYLNDSKSILIEKPIITGITRAKLKITDLLDKNLVFKSSDKNDGGDEEGSENTNNLYSFYFSSNRLITKFKAIIKETDVTYKDILNYTLSCIDRKVLKLVKVYSGLEDKKTYEAKITKEILEIMDFVSFLYSVSPRVNTTIKFCMILSKIIKLAKKKGNFNHDNKHLIFKKIYDDIFMILNKNRMLEHAQVETLYLFIALKELGKEYRLVEKVLCTHFNIDLEQKKCQPLNYFAITVILFYIENKKRYKSVQEILKLHINEIFIKIGKENFHKTTESVLLLFDLLACPYLDQAFKKDLLSLHDITESILQDSIIKKRKFWFTKWSDFEFGKELDAKKSQEVY